MNFEKFTLKAQETVQQAQSLAESNSHGSIDNAHLLKAMILVDKDVLPYLLNKVNVDIKNIELVTDRILESECRSKCPRLLQFSMPNSGRHFLWCILPHPS